MCTERKFHSSNWFRRCSLNCVLTFVSVTFIISLAHASQLDKYCFGEQCQCFTEKIDSANKSRIALTCSSLSNHDHLESAIRTLNQIGSAGDFTFEIVQLNITHSSPNHVYYIFNQNKLPKRIIVGRLTKLIIRGCNLTALPNEHSLRSLMKQYPKLNTIDLGLNRLTTIGEEFDLSLFNVTSISIDNNPWNCEENKWLNIVSGNSKVFERTNETICSQPDPLKGMTFAQAISVEENALCRSCHCYSVIRAEQNVMTVNCTGRQFKSIPPKLPLDTKVVDLSSNSIGSLDMPAGTTSGWHSVIVLDLSNNTIESFEGLATHPELFAGVKKFHATHNRLREISSHILDQMKGVDDLKLGFNPWKCDCNAILFKDWMTRTGLDTDEIRCAHQSSANVRNGLNYASDEETNDKLAGQTIYRIAKSDLCPQPGEPIEYLDILNITLMSLTILIVVKLVYDWRWQKRTGKLPRFFKINI
ncbi:Protein singed wings 2 [Halotydeus destructor]|nr:Protein singed wings 2 [Halotydeus destructor]